MYTDAIFDIELDQTVPSASEDFLGYLQSEVAKATTLHLDPATDKTSTSDLDINQNMDFFKPPTPGTASVYPRPQHLSLEIPSASSGDMNKLCFDQAFTSQGHVDTPMSNASSPMSQHSSLADSIDRDLQLSIDKLTSFSNTKKLPTYEEYINQTLSPNGSDAIGLLPRSPRCGDTVSVDNSDAVSTSSSNNILDDIMECIQVDGPGEITEDIDKADMQSFMDARERGSTDSLLSVSTNFKFGGSTDSLLSGTASTDNLSCRGSTDSLLSARGSTDSLLSVRGSTDNLSTSPGLNDILATSPQPTSHKAKEDSGDRMREMASTVLAGKCSKYLHESIYI